MLKSKTKEREREREHAKYAIAEKMSVIRQFDRQNGDLIGMAKYVDEIIIRCSYRLVIDRSKIELSVHLQYSRIVRSAINDRHMTSFVSTWEISSLVVHHHFPEHKTNDRSSLSHWSPSFSPDISWSRQFVPMEWESSLFVVHDGIRQRWLWTAASSDHFRWERDRSPSDDCLGGVDGWNWEDCWRTTPRFVEQDRDSTSTLDDGQRIDECPTVPCWWMMNRSNRVLPRKGSPASPVLLA